MKLSCRKCGNKQDGLQARIVKDYLPNGGFHLKAFCSACNTFIRNIPHTSPQVLWFGKHKGRPIAVVAKEDPAYLRWLAGQDIKDKLKQSILKELERADIELTQNSFSI